MSRDLMAYKVYSLCTVLPQRRCWLNVFMSSARGKAVVQVTCWTKMISPLQITACPPELSSHRMSALSNRDRTAWQCQHSPRWDTFSTRRRGGVTIVSEYANQEGHCQRQSLRLHQWRRKVVGHQHSAGVRGTFLVLLVGYDLSFTKSLKWLLTIKKTA